MKKLNGTLAAACALLACLPAAAFADDGEFGDILVNIRTRFEGVDQEGKRYADLISSRNQLGWQSPQWNGFTFLAEVENVVVLNDGGYDSGLNGQTQFAKIADDEFTELNRLQLSWQVNENLLIVAGRQYINFDQRRIFGTAGSRQDQKEHDAILFEYREGDFRFNYVFHESVNGGPGDRGVYAGNNHMFRAQYGVNEMINLTGFAYFIDLDENRANRSNFTWGGWLRGERDLGEFGLSYEFMYASQVDYGDNPVDYSVGYFASDVRAQRGPVRFALGYDAIEADNGNRFLNPLGTNHGVLGWADAFTGGARQGTDAGLVDFHQEIAYTHAVDWGFTDEVKLVLRRHDFSAEQGGEDLGEEFDINLSVGLPYNIGLAWRYADFEGTDSPFSPASRTKNWLVLSYRR